MHKPIALAAAALIMLASGCRTPTRNEPADATPRSAPRPMTLGDAERTKLEAQLAEAKAAYEADPGDEAAAIWYGRRLGALGRFDEAIMLYTRALAAHPESYRLLRHRGHRYITVRRFTLAEADFARAWELARDKPDTIEPDSQPAPGPTTSTPRGTDKSSILYHLGLVRYLRGDYEGAVAAYRTSLALSTTNDDNLVSATYWTWLSLKRLGRDRDATAALSKVRDDLDVRENKSYYTLVRAFKAGSLPPELVAQAESTSIDNATIGYGVGAWMRINGQEPRGRAVLQRMAHEGPWASFGVIAAEADLRRESASAPKQ